MIPSGFHLEAMGSAGDFAGGACQGEGSSDEIGEAVEFKGVDEETREAIYAAARRAGLSVSEWLSTPVDQDTATARHDTGEDNPSAIAAALGLLTARLSSMDEATRAMVPGLASRLNQIERHLDHFADSGATGSLKGIAAMVEKLARDIEDADERARAIIEGRRTDRPVGTDANLGRVTDAIRDLDRRIARMGERIVSRQEAAPPLEDIRRRLNALLAEQPTAETTKRTATIDAALRALEARIDQAKARLIAPHDGSERGAVSGDTHQIARIEKRLDEICDRLAERNRTPGQPNAEDARGGSGTANDLAAAIAEISAHQRSLDDHAETLAMRRDQKALSAAMAALQTDIAALSEQVAALSQSGARDQGATFDLARRIEALSTERPLDRSLLTGIRTDLEALRSVIEGQDRASALQQTEARFAAIAEQLDHLNRKTPDHNRLDALGEEVSALRRALEADDSPLAVQRLEMRVAELGRNVEAALSSHNGPVANPEFDQAIQRLEQRLESVSEEISARLSEHTAPVASAEIDRIEQRLDALGRSIVATLAERNSPVAPTVADHLEERLDEIAARIDDLLDRAPAVASIATMHARLQSLIELVEGLSVSQREPAAALDEIKSEIAAIRRDIAGRGQSDTGRLESQIRELAERLDAATRSDSEGSALAELEAQVARLAGQLEEDGPRVEALRHVEASLDRLQQNVSASQRESIEAARAEARAAVEELSASASKSAIDSDLVRALRQDLESLRAAAAAPTAQAESLPQSVDRTLSQVANRLDLLERATDTENQRTGTHGIEATLVRAQPSTREAGPDVSQAPRERATDRRADFIAAARRAAQAAASEAARIEPATADDTGERRSGAFARISQAIRSRKRPLLLAAAAIVLAIGAMHVYGTFTGSDGAAKLAAVEPPVRHDAGIASAGDMLAAAPATASTSKPALVAPTAEPDAKIAFAAPEAVESQFGASTDAPPPSGFDTARPTAAAQPTPTTTPVTLASAPAASAPSVAQGPAPDPHIGSAALVNAAASGDPAAAFEVASRYAEGDHVAKDLANAAQWYQRAAEGGIAVAQYRLGSLYERGQGVAKDLTKAVNWYQRAADQGNVNAMHNLAVLMSEGVDGAPNPQKALQWFLSAADYGVRDSQYNLGVIYARGLGVPQDLVASYKWFAIAAAQGDSDAGARRDEVAKLLSGDDLAKARAAVQAWHAKPPIVAANAVSMPQGGWNGPVNGPTEADRQALVRKIQTLLAEQGFDPGPTDGVVGQRTRDAVKAYQRQNGIAETGQVDSKLMAELADSRV